MLLNHTLCRAGHQPSSLPDWTADILGHCKGPPPGGTFLCVCFSLARILSWVLDFHFHFLSLPGPISSLHACAAFGLSLSWMICGLQPIPPAWHLLVSHWRLFLSGLCVLSVCRQSHVTILTSQEQEWATLMDSGTNCMIWTIKEEAWTTQTWGFKLFFLNLRGSTIQSHYYVGNEGQ